MTKYDIIVGIDPDLEKSGYCVLDVPGREIVSGALSFPELTRCIAQVRKRAQDGNLRLLVAVEAGWLVQKFNYHAVMGKRQGEKVAHDVGENHAVGKIILQECEYTHTTAIAVHPLKKMWRGADGKITKEELEMVIGRKMHRCAQDERDAVLLAWYMSGLPIRLSNPINFR